MHRLERVSVVVSLCAACRRDAPAPPPAAHTPTAQEIAAEILRQQHEADARVMTREAVDRLAFIARSSATFIVGERGAQGYNGGHEPLRFPPSAPTTPAEIPRGYAGQTERAAWQSVTWQSLSFFVDGPYRYSYEYTSDGGSFTARAFGDLDGDGVYSTFERAGRLGATGDVEQLPLRVVRELE